MNSHIITIWRSPATLDPSPSLKTNHPISDNEYTSSPPTSSSSSGVRSVFPYHFPAIFSFPASLSHQSQSPSGVLSFPPQPPDSGLGWRVCCALISSALLSAISLTMIPPTMDERTNKLTAATAAVDFALRICSQLFCPIPPCLGLFVRVASFCLLLFCFAHASSDACCWKRIKAWARPSLLFFLFCFLALSVLAQSSR